MAALMTSDYDDIDRLAIEIAECRSMGITVMPPDINESFMEFAVVPDEKKIRFGMQAIKNVGAGAVDEVLRARSEVGAFPTLESFFTSVHPRIVNRKSIESFIKTGAFDRYENRGVLLENIDVLLAFAAKKQKEAASGQTDLFGNKLESAPMHAPQLVLTQTTSQYEMRHFLAWERELLGLFLSEHPLQNYKILFEEQTIPIESLQPTMDGKKVVIGGIVESIRTIQTKNSQSMAFVKVTSLNGDIEVILFPSVLQQTIDIWAQDSVVIIRGKLSARDKEGITVSELKVIADEARIVTLEQAKAYQATGKKKSISNQQTKKKNSDKVIPAIKLDRIYIRLSSTQDTAVLKKLKDTIDQQPQGQGEVVLIVGQGEQKQAIRLPNKVDSNQELINALEEIFGAENVKR
jgi:DNA polymerase-3 subunit alpha